MCFGPLPFIAASFGRREVATSVARCPARPRPLSRALTPLSTTVGLVMKLGALAVTVAAVLTLSASAAAQDPLWKVIRPNVTWDNHWKAEPRPQALYSVLDEPIYLDERPVVTRDRAAATRAKQRFAVGFSDIAPGVERFGGGQVWIYIGMKKGTRLDFAIRTRRNGRVVTVSWEKRLTPPITLAPENPPVGRNGFRDWLPIGLPDLTRQEANRLSLAVRVSPSSPKGSLSRVYAAFAELYPS
jgi:hypothetical protein